LPFELAFKCHHESRLLRPQRLRCEFGEWI